MCTKDLDQFIHKCNTFQLDRGHVIMHAGQRGEDGVGKVGGEDMAEEVRLGELRRQFEDLLGNANG